MDKDNEDPYFTKDAFEILKKPIEDHENSKLRFRKNNDHYFNEENFDFFTQKHADDDFDKKNFASSVFMPLIGYEDMKTINGEFVGGNRYYLNVVASYEYFVSKPDELLNIYSFSLYNFVMAAIAFVISIVFISLGYGLNSKYNVTLFNYFPIFIGNGWGYDISTSFTINITVLLGFSFLVLFFSFIITGYFMYSASISAKLYGDAYYPIWQDNRKAFSDESSNESVKNLSMKDIMNNFKNNTPQSSQIKIFSNRENDKVLWEDIRDRGVNWMRMVGLTISDILNFWAFGMICGVSGIMEIICIIALVIGINMCWFWSEINAKINTPIEYCLYKYSEFAKIKDNEHDFEKMDKSLADYYSNGKFPEFEPGAFLGVIQYIIYEREHKRIFKENQNLLPYIVLGILYFFMFVLLIVPFAFGVTNDGGSSKNIPYVAIVTITLTLALYIAKYILLGLRIWFDPLRAQPFLYEILISIFQVIMLLTVTITVSIAGRDHNGFGLTQ
jgi:MFS family permease